MPSNERTIYQYGDIIKYRTMNDVISNISEEAARLLRRQSADVLEAVLIGRGQSSVMTDEMYDVYKRHGGHKKHPLDEVQGL